MSYLAKVRNKLITVFLGGDQQIYTWDDAKGQVTLANSGEAYEWSLAFVVPEDLPRIVPLLKPQYVPSGPIQIRSSPSYGSDVGSAAGMQEGMQDA